jgi:hypothetical protein
MRIRILEQGNGPILTKKLIAAFQTAFVCIRYTWVPLYFMTFTPLVKLPTVQKVRYIFNEKIQLLLTAKSLTDQDPDPHGSTRV